MKAIILIVISLFLFAGVYADTAGGSVVVSGTPNITINNPTADSWYRVNFTINASISGAPIATTYRWENSSENGSYTSLTYQGSGIWTKTFSITSVADGNYTLRINSSDAVSHTDNDTVFIYIDDTEPVISSFARIQTGTICMASTLTSSDFSCAATDNGQSFGGSISTVITGLSTSSSGTKTATCTVIDSVGNADTATAQYEVISCGGGGGGSSSTVPRAPAVIVPVQAPVARPVGTPVPSKTPTQEQIQPKADAVTGSAISGPIIPLSTDNIVLGLMALVMIITIIVARAKSAPKQSKSRRW
jgi:hypothetical protein